LKKDLSRQLQRWGLGPECKLNCAAYKKWADWCPDPVAGTTFLSKIKSLWHEVTAYFTSGLRWDVLLLSWYREIFCCIAADWILGSKFGYEISSAGARRVHDASDRVSERGARTPSARRARARRLAQLRLTAILSPTLFSRVWSDPVPRGGPEVSETSDHDRPVLATCLCPSWRGRDVLAGKRAGAGQELKLGAGRNKECFLLSG
jgi:hypothetical protein